MNNITFKGQEIFNPTKNREKELIELFVEYYGEKHRARIEDRINNNMFLYVNNSHRTQTKSQLQVFNTLTVRVRF